ncbi:MAG TPA: cyanophycinase [Patescibacteria group bacterium]|nr:cyanophycinase [Patescibacteria group bacterium]
MAENRDRTLIIIGGHEDKEYEKDILREVARRVGNGKLVITTIASNEPEGMFEEYSRIFRSLGVKHIYDLGIRSRIEGKEERNIHILDDATAVFFTGGDQLKITSQIGDTPIFTRIHEIYNEGGTIAGTSAGASVMCETMLISGRSDESQKTRGSIQLASGFGLIDGMIIDQHFAQRGRIGRLLAAVAQNPKNIGVGIDENTAVIVQGNRSLTVMGEGAVYIVDGTGVTTSNVNEEKSDQTLAVFDIRLHVLVQGDKFDLTTRRPLILSIEEGEKLIGREIHEPNISNSKLQSYTNGHKKQ